MSGLLLFFVGPIAGLLLLPPLVFIDLRGRAVGADALAGADGRHPV